MVVFECEICNENYSNVDENRAPKALKCGHSVCQSCAVQLISGSSILCPFCRQTTEVREGNVKNLQKNFGLVQAIETMKSNESEQEASNGWSERRKCKEHPWNQVEFVCRNIGCLTENQDNPFMCKICEDCGIHEGHEKSLLMLEAIKLRDMIVVQIEKMQSKKKECDRQMKEMEGAGKVTEQLLAQKTAEVNNYFRGVRQAVDKKEAEIKSYLELRAVLLRFESMGHPLLLKTVSSEIDRTLTKALSDVKLNDYELFHTVAQRGGVSWYDLSKMLKDMGAEQPPVKSELDINLPTFHFDDDV